MSEPFIGEIKIFAGNFAIRGYAICEGQLLPISQNTALFSILGTTYGGNGRTDFALPDLRGRFPLQQGQGAGLPNYTLGQRGGDFDRQLTVNEIPAHSHDVRALCNSEDGNTDDPSGGYMAVRDEDQYSDANNDQMAPLTCSDTGGGRPFSIQNPYLAINFLIALIGIFPSRN